MLSRILVGIESTRSSAFALRLGVCWAKRYGATLVGLGIVDEPGIRSIEPAWSVGGNPEVDPVYYMGYEPRLAAVGDQVDNALSQFASRCDAEGVAHAEIKRVGSPHEQIHQAAESCDLILLGRGSQFRFIAGDDEADETLKKVLKDAPCPVIVVPTTDWPDGPAVVAYDGSVQATSALAAFQTAGLAESGKVHIISVGADLSETTEQAETARKFLSDHEIEAVPHALSTSESPVEVILAQVRQLNASLLVMGAYGQPVLREFFFGSVTQKVLEESPVPLFLDH